MSKNEILQTPMEIHEKQTNKKRKRQTDSIIV